MDRSIRDQFGDRLAEFFCTHSADQPCEACFEKGKRAYDKLLDGRETEIATFRANMELTEIENQIAAAKIKADKYSSIMGNIFVNTMTALTFVGMAALLGALVIVAWYGVIKL